MAFVIDALLLLTLIGLVDYLTYSSDEQAYLLKPERLLDLSLGWLYFAGMEICPCRCTIGKYLLDLKVTTSDGNSLSFKNATIRYFAKPLSVIEALLHVPLSQFSQPQQTLHDRLANSIVISR